MIFSLVKFFFLLPILPLQAQGFDLIPLKLHKQQEEIILISQQFPYSWLSPEIPL